MRVPPAQSTTSAAASLTARSMFLSFSCERDARQARAKDEAFDVLQAVRHAVEELQHQPRIFLHRAADVGDQHNRALLDLARLPGQRQRQHRRAAPPPRSPGACAGVSPLRLAIRRRDRRRTACQRIACISRLIASSSSGVICEKSLRLQQFQVAVGERFVGDVEFGISRLRLARHVGHQDGLILLVVAWGARRFLRLCAASFPLFDSRRR